MRTKLFDDDELIEAYNEGWEGSEEWKLVQITDTYALRLTRALQVHHAGVTIIAGDTPIGSGVLVKGARGHGILTAGHVCGAIEEAIERKRRIAYVPQGTREPSRPGEKAPVLVRPLTALKVHSVHVAGTPVPDYGCIAVPAVDGHAIEAWGTFINITPEGPSLKQTARGTRLSAA